MSLNWKEIDLILYELPLENSFIQKIRQPDFQTLVLDIYSPGEPYQLLVSLKQEETRLHRISNPVRGAIKLQRFAQLLRSKIQGGRITNSAQIAQERIIRLDVTRVQEITYLFIRLWGGAANIIATDDSFIILDAFYRRPKRKETSGNRFDPYALIQTSKARNSFDPDTFRIREYDKNISFNQCIENEYLQNRKSRDLENLRQVVADLLGKEAVWLQKSIDRLKTKLAEYKNYNELKEIGDLITCNLHRIKRGDTWVEVHNFYNNNQLYRLELNSQETPEENAQKYYKRYNKAKEGLKYVQEELAIKEKSLNRIYLQKKELLTSSTPVNQLNTDTEINKLLDFLHQHQESGKTKHKNIDKQSTEKPGLYFQSGAFTLILGRSGKENDALLRHYVRGNDLWLHNRDFPGSYVFIKNIPGKTVPLETLLDAGNLALYFSKGRSSGKGELYYTQVKYLRRAKNGKPGLVIPTQEKNLSIRLEEKRLARILGKENYTDG